MAHQESSNKKSPHHVTPLKVFYNIWIALLIFTALTVGTSYMNFGHFNIIIAMAIATVKALLVTSYFMGLKYDSDENNYTFYSSFIFLGIFIGLTGSDIFFRRPQEAAAVTKDMVVLPGAGGAVVNMDVLIKSSPELVAKGKSIFTAQCITCHGADGKGDGAAAAAMNPKPRNFTVTEGWKNGRTEAAVFKTISNGIPGTSMPSFASIETPDRMSLVHYVRTFMASAPQDSAEDISALKALGGAAGTPKLPLDFIMNRMALPNK